jgi:anti-sigma regulatory factor (Ser/Thr protein kinase)
MPPQSAREGSDSHSIDVRLASNAWAPWKARRAIKDLGLPAPMHDDALLLVSELVTNCFRHAGLGSEGTIEIRLTRSGNHLRVEVSGLPSSDLAGPLAGAIRPRPGARSGWGLYLVDRLAVRWGSAPGRYWFELEADPADRP